MEAPDLLQAGAPPQVLPAWDASAYARRDAAADGAHPQRLPLRPQVAVVEKSAGRAPDVQGRAALHRQWVLRAALAELDEPAPYIPAVARFAERSYAALEIEEQPDAPQLGTQAVRQPKPPGALPLLELVLRAATISRAVPAVRQLEPRESTATLPEPAAQPQPAGPRRKAVRSSAVWAPRPPVEQPQAAPEAHLPVSSLEALLPVFLPEPVRWDAALTAEPPLPSAA